MEGDSLCAYQLTKHSKGELSLAQPSSLSAAAHWHRFEL